MIGTRCKKGPRAPAGLLQTADLEKNRIHENWVARAGRYLDIPIVDMEFAQRR